MATPSPDDLLAHARSLSFRDRARMVRELIDSLDEQHLDADAEQAWAVEIEKRARDVISGKEVVVEAGAMFTRIKNQLSSPAREAAQAPPSGRSRPKRGGKVVRGRGSRSR